MVNIVQLVINQTNSGFILAVGGFDTVKSELLDIEEDTWMEIGDYPLGLG